MTEKKIALLPCSGMSPYGLITRAATMEIIEENDELLLLCIGATSADIEGFDELIRQYPIIVINGCEESCVYKILLKKGVKAAESINVREILDAENLKPTEIITIDEEGRKCIEITKKKLKEILEKEIQIPYPFG